MNTAISARAYHPIQLSLLIMWCTNCQQDVPALANGDMARCAQCGRFLRRGAHELPIAEEPVAITNQATLQAAATLPTELDDDWALEQRLRHLQRRLRYDDAAAALPTFHNSSFTGAAETKAPLASASQTSTPPKRHYSILGRIMLGLGSLTVLYGAALLVWWLIDGSRELWTFGVPTILLGQTGLLFGLVFQLRRLSKVNRSATETLESLERRLSQMNLGPVNVVPAGLQNPAFADFTHLSRSPATHSLHF
jgi:hypothetical protein